MKKIFTIIFCLTITVIGFVNAQTGLNFSAGINYSNFEIKNFEGLSSEPRSGYFVGVAPSHRINDKLNIVVDFQLSTKGSQLIFEDNSPSPEVRISYIDIIPEIEYALLEYLLLGVGVNSAFKINEAHKLEDQGWASIKESGTIDLFDFGLTGKVKVKFRNFFGFVRYNFGLTSISNIKFTDITGQTTIDSNQFNRNLQIGVGYTLRFVK